MATQREAFEKWFLQNGRMVNGVIPTDKALQKYDDEGAAHHEMYRYLTTQASWEAWQAAQSALAEQPALATCKSCNGNDGDAPCAYPSEGKHGCLRDARLSLAEQDDEAVAWAFESATEITEGLPSGDVYGGFKRSLSYKKPREHPQFRNAYPLYRRPAPNTYTEHDIDVAIGAVDWANTSWQQAAVEAKKLVMRFVGSQVTMEPKQLSEEVNVCAYAQEIGMPEHNCSVKCIYKDYPPKD